MYNMSTKRLQQTGHMSEATLHIMLMAYDKNHYSTVFYFGICNISVIRSDSETSSTCADIEVDTLHNEESAA